MTDDPHTAADYTPEAVKWQWRDRLPEGFVCIVGGRPGSAKSMLCSHLSADFTRRGMNVIYSSTENPKKQMTIPRLIAAGAELGRVDLRRFVLPNDLNRLEETIWKDDVRLVMLDPIADHLTVRRHSDAIRSVSFPLVEMAERTKCIILLTEHFLRDVSPRMHPLRAIQGSGSGLPAVAQMVFIIGPDPEDPDRTILAAAKANLADDELKALEFTFDEKDVPVRNDKGEYEDASIGFLRYVGETKFPARKLLAATKTDDDGPPTKIAAAAKWLTDYLKVAPNYRALAKEIYEDGILQGHARKTMKRTAEEMGIVKSAKGGKHLTWTLPQDLIDIVKDDG